MSRTYRKQPQSGWRAMQVYSYKDGRLGDRHLPYLGKRDARIYDDQAIYDWDDGRDRGPTLSRAQRIANRRRIAKELQEYYGG